MSIEDYSHRVEMRKLEAEHSSAMIAQIRRFGATS
jgi:hypothetical protein